LIFQKSCDTIPLKLTTQTIHTGSILSQESREILHTQRLLFVVFVNYVYKVKWYKKRRLIKRHCMVGVGGERGVKTRSDLLNSTPLTFPPWLFSPSLSPYISLEKHIRDKLC
jgi:hypothetical protein